MVGILELHENERQNEERIEGIRANDGRNAQIGLRAERAKEAQDQKRYGVQYGVDNRSVRLLILLAIEQANQVLKDDREKLLVNVVHKSKHVEHAYERF